MKSHELRKLSFNTYKGKRTLVKPHIWTCTNGLPVYSAYCFGDGMHSDGKIFNAALDKQYVEECLEFILDNKQFTKEHKQRIKEKKETKYTKVCDIEYDWETIDKEIFKCIENFPEHICWRSETTCKELLNLQKLMGKDDDRFVSDAGYKVDNWKVICTRDSPQSKDDDDRLTTLDCTYRRSLTFVRQTQERVNSWIKRNKFCDCKLSVYDVRWIPYVWNIVMADMVYLNKILMADNESTEELANRIIDMRPVVVNPADIWVTTEEMEKEAKK